MNLREALLPVRRRIHLLEEDNIALKVTKRISRITVLLLLLIQSKRRRRRALPARQMLQPVRRRPVT